MQVTLDQAAQELKNIRAMVVQNDVSGARAKILTNLSDLDALSKEGHSNAQNLYASFIETLDEIDHAEPAAITLAATIGPGEGIATMATMASGSDTIWVIAHAPGQTGSLLVHVRDGAVASSTALDLEADLMIPSPPSVMVINRTGRTVSVIGAPSGVQTLPTPDRILSAAWFLDYAYILTTSGILKVSDLDTKKPVTKQWLSDVSELSPAAVLIAVDGDIWTLSSNGTLTKYYRGEKVSDAQLPLAINEAHRLLTTEDMPFLFVTDVALKRVHVIDKESLAIIHTVTVETEQEIRDMFLGTDFTLHLLAADGKIWRIE